MFCLRAVVVGSACLFVAGLAEPLWAAPINSVSYGSLTATNTINFSDVLGGTTPGTNYNGVFESGKTAFGERFVGQTNTPVGNFDVLSGSPSGPLALAAGLANQNLNVVAIGNNVLAGVGPLGFSNVNGRGEGSIAILFDFDQSQFGLQFVGTHNGSAEISFFRRDGSLIQSILLTGLGSGPNAGYYGFLRDGGINDIAGISIHNADIDGIAIDNLKHDVAGIVGDPPPIDVTPIPATETPEPTSLALWSLAGLASWSWRRRSSRTTA